MYQEWREGDGSHREDEDGMGSAAQWWSIKPSMYKPLHSVSSTLNRKGEGEEERKGGAASGQRQKELCAAIIYT